MLSVETIAESSLVHWGLQNADIKLIARRENSIFCVTDKNKKFALRLHRPGYQSFDSIISELQWMSSLDHSGVSVPKPIPANAGSLLIEHGGYHIDLLTWLDGTPLGVSGADLKIKDSAKTFYEIGQEMARLHEHADRWAIPDGFVRMHWDRNGLVGNNPLWGKFWENPSLSENQKKLFVQARDHARKVLAKNDPDFGLIHADLVSENILISSNCIQFIDFDDCGFGFRLFDVATALLKNTNDQNRETLQSNLIDGYSNIRSMDWKLLPLFLMLRSLTYVGWVVPRIKEPGSLARQERFIEKACKLTENYLDSV